MKNIFNTYPFLIPLIAILVTEALKLLITFVKKGGLEIKDFFSTGGIPSGHSTFVSALIVVTLMEKGINSFEFAIAFVFGFLFIFDSVKLRAEAGKHAAALNKLTGAKNLNERLGHTMSEALTGIFLGSGMAFIMMTI